MSQITTWQNGRFSTVAEPEWWDDEWHRVVNSTPRIDIGEQEKLSIRAFHFSIELGWLVLMEHGGFLSDAWILTDADLLDFMTTRAPAWMALPPPPLPLPE